MLYKLKKVFSSYLNHLSVDLQNCDQCDNRSEQVSQTSNLVNSSRAVDILRHLWYSGFPAQITVFKVL